MRLTLLRLLRLGSVLALANPVSAQVFARPTDPKQAKSSNAVSAGTLNAVTQLTSQNRGKDALMVLKSAVDAGTIPSDHRSGPPLAAQDLATMNLINSGQMLTQAQVLQGVNVLCNNRRGDEAAVLYERAIEGGIIPAHP